ncbi:accessory factor UbiK family protein [Sandaracinobacteroides saxicola]|uniref:accessory factor UbiK family protein n=1 Tax=Sandaracinobacteroides saxicola TaxID=2759707 RepID=UPI001FB04EC5|nr:accessory factor UbiK family protein [Sandaracinobacteroides saxicola]
MAGTVAGAGREAEAKLKEKLREAMGGVDMVSREEFEAVREMAANARAEVAALRAELDALKAKG